MNNDSLLEREPVIYGPSSVKTLFFNVSKKCFCFRMHWHERMELLRVFEGRLTVTLGNKTVTVEKDEAVIIPPRTPHMAQTEKGARYCAVMFDIRTFYNHTEIGEKLLSALFDGRVTLKNLTDSKSFIETIDAVSKSTASDLEAFSVMADLYRLLVTLFRECVLDIYSETATDRVMGEIISYIEENFSEEISTSHICQHFGYTVPYFCKKFKDYTGLSPMNYLKIYRMEKAYSLMKKSNLKINEIALNCGFSDANYFTRCFTSHFGFPPTRYLKIKK